MNDKQNSGEDLVKVPLNPNGDGRPTAPTFNLPELPDPPSAAFPAPPKEDADAKAEPPKQSGDDLDFDDLTRRFEELKKRR